MKKLFTFSLMVLTIGCSKDDDNRNATSPEVFFKDAIFYEGHTEVVDILIEEEDAVYTLSALSGQILVYFNDGIMLSDAQKAISEIGGQIIEQIPAIGYYLVSVTKGLEMQFVSDIYNKNANYAFINTVSTITACSPPKAMILDTPYDNHRNKVAQAYMKSATDVSTVNYEEFPIKDHNGKNTKYVDSGQAINAITKGYPNGGLYNMSFGASLERNGQEITWKQATPTERQNYIREYKADIKKVVKRLAEMRKKGVADIVVTIAAGNAGMSKENESAWSVDEIINTMVNQTVDGKSVLSNEEKAVLSEQILIVGDNSNYSNGINNVYSPTSPNSAAGGKVDISDLNYVDQQGNTSTLEGTSFAAPKALAIIRDVMAETCLTARQAMQAAKQAIYENDGILTRAGALEQAKTLFNIKDDNTNLSINQSWFKNTKWDVTESGEMKATITWSGPEAPPKTENTYHYAQSFPLEFTSTGYTADPPSDMPSEANRIYQVITPGTLIEESTYNTTKSGVTLTLKYTRTYSLTSITAQTINVETKMNLTSKTSAGGMTITSVSKLTAQGKGTRVFD